MSTNEHSKQFYAFGRKHWDNKYKWQIFTIDATDGTSVGEHIRHLHIQSRSWWTNEQLTQQRGRMLLLQLLSDVRKNSQHAAVACGMRKPCLCSVPMAEPGLASFLPGQSWIRHMDPLFFAVPAQSGCFSWWVADPPHLTITFSHGLWVGVGEYKHQLYLGWRYSVEQII